MGNLKINNSIKTTNPKDKVYCHDDYAQKLYDLISGNSSYDYTSFEDGQLITATVLRKTDKEIILDSNSETIFIDLEKEKKSKPYLLQAEIGSKIEVCIKKDVNQEYYTGSMDNAHPAKVRESLFESLYKASCAFNCVVLERSKGGYFVDIDGTKCFMPGSLAAANVLLDFDSLIGKTVPVMVENYIKENDTFVVSNKKYIQFILPNKIQDLTIQSKTYEGTITGIMKFGTFIEFDEIFTGLLHVNEMTDENKKEYKNWKPGQKIQFRIKSIDEKNRIILTEREDKSV